MDERIFALTTRGLEAVAARELDALASVTVTETAYRRVTAVCSTSLASLMGLSTVDDVFVDIATWTDIGHRRDTLSHLRDLAVGLDQRLQHAADLCAGLRSIPAQPLFSVTANFVGKRNYNTDEIKQMIAAGIERVTDWSYADNDGDADLNVRVFIEHTTAYIGLRLAEESLQKRDYKQEHLPGSLKPPVAAAMLKLAEVERGMSLLDSFCGTGTILIEAAFQGMTAYGGDSNADAIHKAQTNIVSARVNGQIQRLDARRLPFADRSIDRIVSNLPWGRQVKVDAEMESLYRDSFAEMRRVLAPDGRIALLTSAPQLLPAPVRHIEISLFGQNPVIALYS